MRLVLISDTHNQLNAIIKDLPEGDVLIHSGDFSFNGKLKEIIKFNDDLYALKKKYKKIYWTPGNHDFNVGYPGEYNDLSHIITNGVLLHDSGHIFQGIKFYGSGWTPWFWDWNFNFPQNDGGQMAVQTWKKIPDDTDVLVTHGPPRGILDWVERGEHVGCPHLLNRIMNLPKLKLHVFGHIHGGYGIEEKYDKTFINASTCTEEYRPFNMPIVFDI